MTRPWITPGAPALTLGTVGIVFAVALAALTAIPASLGARQPAAAILQAEAA